MLLPGIATLSGDSKIDAGLKRVTFMLAEPVG